MHSRYVSFACTVTVPFVLATTGVVLVDSGCLPGGKLSPLVAPIVGAIDATVCATVPMFAHEANVGQVCSAMSGIVQGILNELAQQPLVVATVASTANSVPAVKQCHPIRFHKVTIGHIRADYAPLVQLALAKQE